MHYKHMKKLSIENDNNKGLKIINESKSFKNHIIQTKLNRNAFTL